MAGLRVQASRHQKTARRRPLCKELRDLIFRMAAENPTWGAPRLHGELLKLGQRFASAAVGSAMPFCWQKRP